MAAVTFVLGDTLSSRGLVWWLVVGLVAGFLASRVMRGGGYGIISDILAGIVGASIGGWLSGFLGFTDTYSLIGSIVIAFIGACVLIAILHAFSRSGRRA
jgi:uncharacterized membrane protein YeaQ/YmgE (transglycosylase-associated protein family)